MATSACPTGHRSSRARSSARTEPARSSDVRSAARTVLWSGRARSASASVARCARRACSSPHVTPGGYGWLFPRGRQANLGCGVAIGAHQALGPLLADLALGLARAGIVASEPIGRTGGAIPVGGIVGPTGQLGRVQVLLAGDAAGLAHPVTGAGIAAAVLSGTMAGEAAAASISGHRGALPAYAEELRDLFAAAFGRALARRRATWRDTPDPAALRRGWPGFSAYWQDDGMPV
jgi:digeranylgeranylglycerophospholipid reductase